MRKGFLIIASAFTLALVSCKNNSNTKTNRITESKPVEEITITEKDNEVIKKKLPFSNADKNFSIKDSYIDTYFFDNSVIPYVSIDDYINNVGYYPNKVSVNDNIYTMMKGEYDYKFVVDSDKDTITVNNYNYYSIDDKDYNELPEYHENLLMLSTEIRDNSKPDVIDISKYNFDIKEVENKNVIPFHVVNSLFSLESYYYLYYLGDKYIGNSYDNYYINVTPTFTPTKEFMQYNYDFLDFTFNELYGLNNYFDFKTSDNLALYKTDIMNQDHTSFGVDSFISSLSDLHTYILKTDMFNENINEYAPYSDRERNFWNVHRMLKKDFSSKNYSDCEIIDSNTLMITFNEFEVELEDGIDSKIKGYLDFAKENNYKNIIFNVTLNGGGDTFSLAQILGLLTNDDIYFEFKNTKSGQIATETFKVDANRDGSYTDDDAYDFNYFVLSSEYTFSCANDFVNYCKEYKLAKIIGKKSGGGGCAIYPFTTPTGMLICASSLNGLFDENDKLIELGIDVDYEIDYDDIYDKDVLSDVVSKASTL